jgi:hypothetical protein
MTMIEILFVATIDRTSQKLTEKHKKNEVSVWVLHSRFSYDRVISPTNSFYTFFSGV